MVAIGGVRETESWCRIFTRAVGRREIVPLLHSIYFVYSFFPSNFYFSRPDPHIDFTFYPTSFFFCAQWKFLPVEKFSCTQNILFYSPTSTSSFTSPSRILRLGHPAVVFLNEIRIFLGNGYPCMEGAKRGENSYSGSLNVYSV